MIVRLFTPTAVHILREKTMKSVKTLTLAAALIAGATSLAMAQVGSDNAPGTSGAPTHAQGSMMKSSGEGTTPSPKAQTQQKDKSPAATDAGVKQEK
jgi:Spy/CpxP family protein refolding chaperone